MKSWKAHLLNCYRCESVERISAKCIRATIVQDGRKRTYRLLKSQIKYYPPELFVPEWLSRKVGLETKPLPV